MPVYAAILALTPQSVNVFGGYKVQGRGDAAQTLFEDAALALEAAGAQLLVLECVPVELAKRITDALTIPVIGIGAGNVTDGQILVMRMTLSALPAATFLNLPDFTSPKRATSAPRCGSILPKSNPESIRAKNTVSIKEPCCADY